MLKIERRILDFIRQHIILFACLAVFVIGVVARVALFPFISDDFRNFNLPWLNELRRIGVNVMIDEERFNYSPFLFYVYQFAANLTSNLYSELVGKVVSVLPEVLVSLSCFCVLDRIQRRGKPANQATFIIFSAFWLNPVLLLNGAAWGQTDCYYAFFSLLAVWLLMCERPVWAIAAMGVSCAVKQQGLFLLPLFILMYFVTAKPFSLLWLVLIPLIMLLTSLPMALFDVSPFYLFKVYALQTGEHLDLLTMNYPNFYTLVASNFEVVGLYMPVCIALLAFAFCFAAVWMIRCRTVLQGQNILLADAWTVLLCTYLLPCMHDRYAIVGELLLLCYALLSRTRTSLIATVLCYLATLNAYAIALSSPFCSTKVAMLMMTVAIILITRELFTVTGRKAVSHKILM